MGEDVDREKLAGSELLVPLNVYLEAGVHIGTYMCTKHMERFVFKQRPDGPYIIDVKKIDERIRIAGRFIAAYKPESVLAVSARPYGFQPVQRFAELTGGKAVVGRFIPGTLTNPNLSTYIEPDIIVVTDPRVDLQALLEASRVGIPVVAIVSTDSKTSNVDLVIPGNNKGRKSLAVIYWLLARQTLRERGVLPSSGELSTGPETFETKVPSK